ncbi:MAG: peptidase family protein [Conexibacter sp.]|nr:peptidase family protein [Conexibacter sp.]
MIVDAHTDLLLELVHRDAEDDPFGTHWLPNLQRGGVALQICPTYVADLALLPEQALPRALRQVAAYRRALREHGDSVLEIRTAADVDALAAGDRLGLMLSMEGMEPLGYDPALIDVFWELGVRMGSLTWNRRNPFADGAAEPANGGLSRLGAQLVDRMVQRGIVIDLAHASERTFWDVIERTEGRPVVVSHGACRSVCETPRNLTDEQLKAIAASGGAFGMMLVPIAIDPDRWEIERAVDHIAHAVDVMGHEHVGLGGDFMQQLVHALDLQLGPDSLLPGGMPPEAALEGLAGPEDYPALVAALGQRGFAGEQLANVLGQSFLRVLRTVLPAV